MPFTSINFIFFIVGALLFYYVVPLRFRWIALLLASYVFYMVGGWTTVFYIVFTTVLTFCAAQLLGRLNTKLAGLPGKDAEAIRIKKLKKYIVSLTILICFGMLFVLRYWNFTLELIGSDRWMEQFGLNLLIPLGVSFFIFQSVGYVIDVYRGKHSPEGNLVKYALFVSFFPQIIQGPISRFHELSPQLDGNAFDFTNIKYGIQLIMWGYFKKLVIADRTAVAVNYIFENITIHSGAVIAFAVFFYCIQLYGDFSGGIDITRGVAKMFGIDLAINFRRPIFAISLADFWRRWHITLGAWLKDYLFYSMALSRPIIRIGKFTRRKIGGTLGKVIPTAICTFTVYFLIGVWHGANFRWVAFGIWNATIITSSLLMAGNFTWIKAKLRINDKSKCWWVVSIARTAFIVFMGRYITRSPRLVYTLSMWRSTFTNFQFSTLFDGTLLQFGLTSLDMVIVALGVLVLLFIEFRQEKGVEIRESLAKRCFIFQMIAMFLLFAAIFFFGIWGDAEYFIYMQF
ncbi:MAG: MBOAT family protein [Defluviitaleaceae bacterium]|nr:MBOAT family protein [Defluviitaleaceae bacterium]